MLCAMLPAALAGAAFRPPAIPLITTDPYFQTWVFGSAVTDEKVTHWDGYVKRTLGMIRVKNQTFRVLGNDDAEPLVPAAPGPANVLKGKDVSPGLNDIRSFVADADTCNRRCYGDAACKAFVMHPSTGTCYLKSADAPVVPSDAADGYILTGSHPSTYLPSALPQTKVVVHPTSTIATFSVPGTSAATTVEMRITSTLFTDDYARLSRPISYVSLEVKAGPEDDLGEVSFYFDMSAEHAVNQKPAEITWTDWSKDGWCRIGTTAQPVLKTAGDKTNIDWGYLYVAGTTASALGRCGSAQEQRSAFVLGGALPTAYDKARPRNSDDDLPSASVVQSLGKVGQGGQVKATILAGYDSIEAVSYYGEQLPGFWTRTWPTMPEALSAAAKESETMVTKSDSVDASLEKAFTAAGGEQYSQIAALVYRQTLAATKLVWRESKGVMWNFLKEISTNGDMQTMDVIFPASPMFLYSNPELLRLLLVPVLEFANNATPTPYTSPYSPHQIGTYPIADATTASQEQMPMENTGNMFLMIKGILDRTSNTTWVKQYMPLLHSWAQYLANAPGSLPYPANQLCTDDFTGKLANNSNLAAKGIVALGAFSEICSAVTPSDPQCAVYRKQALEFATVWQNMSYEASPLPHSQMAYGAQNSYSLKYNLVWQKLLNMTWGPFPWKEVTQDQEVPYYMTLANKYGVPMDQRHTYVKLDWLSWAAVMADKQADFQVLFDPIWGQANATDCRVPLTDLFDTKTATCAYGQKAFVARPVVGGIFAKLIVPEGWGL